MKPAGKGVRKGAIAVAAITAAMAQARAEFSAEWNAAAEKIRAECAAFESRLVFSAGVAPFVRPRSRGGYSWPRGAAGRPHVCLFVAYEIDANGAPENIRVIFKAPDNLHYRFERAAKREAENWRFDRPPGAVLGMVTRIDLVSMPGYRFTYSYFDFAGASTE